MAVDPANRCRLIISLPAFEGSDEQIGPILARVLDAGDVACVFISAAGLGEQAFLSRCKSLVPLIQEKDVAVIIAGDSQIFGRAQADGILIENGNDALKDAIARFSPHKIVGCGAIRERHRALEAGELNPDFIFLGSLDKDIRAQPHRKNLAMADWWSKLVEIPCAVMGGNSLESVIDVAKSGAEFVVLSKAIFEHEGGPDKAVGQANELLDNFGPRFDEE